MLIHRKTSSSVCDGPNCVWKNTFGSVCAVRIDKPDLAKAELNMFTAKKIIMLYSL